MEKRKSRAGGGKRMKEDNGLLETQLKVGKVVLEQMLELIYRPNMRGVVMPVELNGYKYNISIVREDNA